MVFECDAVPFDVDGEGVVSVQECTGFLVYLAVCGENGDGAAPPDEAFAWMGIGGG